MKIKLSEIKSASKRVRQSWDVDKLAELTTSIKEQGMLVPVKLRPNDEGYDVVFGHRRVAAAREAGLTEVEAIVEGIDDDAAYIQALTENVVREDMEDKDIALALKAIKEDTDWNNTELGEMFGWSRHTIEDYLGILDYADVINAGAARISARIVRKTKSGVGAHDTDGVSAILKKAVDEGLSSDQAHDLGKEYTRAKTAFGNRGAKTVLDKPWLTSQPETVTLEAEATRILKRKPPELKIKVDEGEILFSWVKDHRVIAAEQALKDISTLLSIMVRSGDDPGGARQMIKSLRKLAVSVVTQMDNILES